jgi:hypothetical protein
MQSRVLACAALVDAVMGEHSANVRRKGGRVKYVDDESPPMFPLLLDSVAVRVMM